MAKWQTGTNDPNLIEECETLKGICYKEDTGTNEDMNLIASAPDMLEALEYVVKYHWDNDSGEGELFGLDYVTTCINAIRKAKG